MKYYYSLKSCHSVNEISEIATQKLQLVYSIGLQMLKEELLFIGFKNTNSNIQLHLY